MRALLVMVLVWTGCAAEEAPGTPSSPSRETRRAPRFGGALVHLGGRDAELVVHETGELHLHVPAALEDAAITVSLDDEAGASHAIAMRWHDAVQGFVGRMEATPAPGEATVLMVHDGVRTEVGAEVAALLPAPPHDGSIVAVGEHTVEVLVSEGGAAHAYVLDDPEHRLDVDLTLNLAGDDGHLHPLALRWDDDAGHFVGHLEGLHPAPGPLEVILAEGQEQSLGHGSLLGVGLARPDARGADVPDDFRLEMPSLGAEVPGAVVIPSEERGDEG